MQLSQARRRTKIDTLYFTIDENTSSIKNATNHTKNIVSMYTSAVFGVNPILISSRYRTTKVYNIKLIFLVIAVNIDFYIFEVYL